MIGHFLWTLFNYPSGIVLGNLMASAMWGAPAGALAVAGYIKLHRKIDRHHQWHLDQHKGD